jgi:hypothetical protein
VILRRHGSGCWHLYAFRSRRDRQLNAHPREHLQRQKRKKERPGGRDGDDGGRDGMIDNGSVLHEWRSKRAVIKIRASQRKHQQSRQSRSIGPRRRPCLLPLRIVTSTTSRCKHTPHPAYVRPGRAVCVRDWPAGTRRNVERRNSRYPTPACPGATDGLAE